MDIINALEEEGRLSSLSLKEIKERLLNKSTKVCFFTFTEELISDLKEAKRFGNARAYKSVLGAVKELSFWRYVIF